MGHGGEGAKRMDNITLFVCVLGRKRPVRGTTMMDGVGSMKSDKAAATWQGISLERWYSRIARTFTKRRWISPYLLYESMMWRIQHQIDPSKPEANTMRVIKLGREPSGKGRNILFCYRMRNL